MYSLLICDNILETQANQKKLIEYLISGSVKKVEKLLDTGLDPNYVAEDGSKLSYLHLALVMFSLSQ